MNTKLTLLTLLTTYFILFQNAYGVEEGDFKGNGGDPCENHFLIAANKIKRWIYEGGVESLQLPKHISLKTYTTSILKAIDEVKVSCTNNVLFVGPSEKTCRSIPDYKLVVCNRDSFKSINFEERIKLVHHQLALLAGLEENNEEMQNYSFSNQLSSFIKKDTEQLSEDRIDGSFVDESFAKNFKVLSDGICFGNQTTEKGLQKFQALQTILDSRDKGRQFFRKLKHFMTFYNHIWRGATWDFDDEIQSRPEFISAEESFFALVECVRSPLLSTKKKAYRKYDSTDPSLKSFVVKIVETVGNDQILSHSNTEKEFMDYMFKLAKVDIDYLKNVRLRKSKGTIMLAKILAAFRGLPVFEALDLKSLRPPINPPAIFVSFGNDTWGIDKRTHRKTMQMIKEVDEQGLVLKYEVEEGRNYEIAVCIVFKNTSDDIVRNIFIRNVASSIVQDSEERDISWARTSIYLGQNCKDQELATQQYL